MSGGSRSGRRDSVLVVEHQPGVSSGMVGRGLSDAGFELDVWRPYDGDVAPLPDDIGDWGGLLILGGSMASWDDEAAPWLAHVRSLVVAAEEAAVPTLGICLGHQVAALALGGAAAVNPTGRLIDVVPVGWTPAAEHDPLVAGIGDTVAVHGNRDVVVEPPPGATVLARMTDGHIQAARWGHSVWGVQFHPEAGSELVERWVTTHRSLFEELGVDTEAYLASARRHDEQLAASARQLASNFGALIQRRR